MTYVPQWITEPYTTKKDLISKITGPASISAFSECLKHQYKGSAFSGVLYCVFKNPTIISVFILKTDPKARGWRWKRQDEVDHPLFHSCPKSFFELAPIACQAWRAECLAKKELVGA